MTIHFRFDLGTPLPSPTSFLPSVKAILKCSTERLVQSLEYLRRVYLPDVRGTRRIKAASALRSNGGLHASKSESESESRSSKATVDEELESLRTDPFERSYATRWLTSLVDVLVSASETSEERPIDPSPLSATFNSQSIDYESVIQLAACILAVCAGTAATGAVTRTYAFEGSVTINSHYCFPRSKIDH
ncbi:uncharacterized protein STEHIDRAFT_154574 [Stereum hirsutum FP-91666 SS1]|uniref:uncharacterized protein n=1 Tax=Stereum hirsutum (strain FP-91666) TaxID=721885 RepID=UPI000440DC1D|nr:uncharacterized protein STEHIDRAFT_154574 [Stereum hirsutum FP-91666 SS1]EIM88858.1 hypothetical protein STEHIDRAFT_154574 [Stereum hirsutum FP-91666 SS1]